MLHISQGKGGLSDNYFCYLSLISKLLIIQRRPTLYYSIFYLLVNIFKSTHIHCVIYHSKSIVYIFFYLFISPPYKYVIILMVTRILIISSIRLPIATALSEGSASGDVDWANLFRVVSSFRNSGIASSLH
jgi:hypothetical protein